MTIDLSRFHQVFFDESAEHLAEMEHLLLALDVGQPDTEQLNAIFRAAHSIKGGSGTVGFTDMTEVTHVLENLLDRLRKQEIALRTEMVDVFLEATDVLKDQLSAHISGDQADPEHAVAIREKLTRLTQGETSPPPAPAVAPSPSCNSYIIEFTLDSQISGDDINNLLGMLGDLGELQILQRPEEISAKKTSNKKSSKKHKKTAEQHWQLRLISTSGSEDIRGLFEFLLPPEQVLITAETTPIPEDDAYGLFDTSPGDTVKTAATENAYGLFDTPEVAIPTEDQGYGLFVEIAPPLAPVAPPPVAASQSAAQDRQDRRTGDRRGSAFAAESSSIRVSVDKVDQLINLVGELVITQAMLKQSATVFDPVLYEKLHNGMAQLERNTRDLQESVMSIRMMPIGSVFSRFPRVIRDLASKLGKQVELVMAGENTELDKSLIEKIADPLTHLVRNSLDHGIETPDKRVAAGKPEKGTITLSASHQGGSIMIEVADDGAGLNRDKILAKAQ